MGRWSRRLAGPFLDFVGSAHGESVLDVGCGTGSLTFALNERCQPRQLRGVDFSPAYIEHATRQNHDPQIVFEVGDACALTELARIAWSFSRGAAGWARASACNTRSNGVASALWRRIARSRSALWMSLRRRLGSAGQIPGPSCYLRSRQFLLDAPDLGSGPRAN